MNKTRESISYSNTVDLQYTLTNIWEHMIKGLDSYTGQMAPDVNAPIDYKVALELLNDFSEKFFGESQYKLSNFCRITQKDKYNLLHLKMGERTCMGFLYSRHRY